MTEKRRTAKKLKELRSAFETHLGAAELEHDTPLPSDTSRIVRIGTWNIREFDSSSYGFRSKEATAYIAEILSYFDLIAVQEVRRDLAALNKVKALLGPSWDYVATDVTAGDSGNKERMAFLFNRGKVCSSN